MGCSSSKANTSALARMLEYQKMAATEEAGLHSLPKGLNLEDWGEPGLVSPRTAFNMMNAGYCSAFIQNPSYILVLDFRCLDSWLLERVVTSLHYERLPHLEKGLHRYSSILLYDR